MKRKYLSWPNQYLKLRWPCIPFDKIYKICNNLVMYIVPAALCGAVSQVYKHKAKWKETSRASGVTLFSLDSKGARPPQILLPCQGQLQSMQLAMHVLIVVVLVPCTKFTPSTFPSLWIFFKDNFLFRKSNSLVQEVSLTEMLDQLFCVQTRGICTLKSPGGCKPEFCQGRQY